ncbi:hypothetical protein ASU35_13160 [Acetivibrio ethanolgignens]|uniref:Uncharacterized protein n=1 Tax=Acetivibrio ethanolgignens TaxID=290052 RepID=A0A0V8QCF7_9FIRM|nr:hypothetical protein [Acetivibrio ethanolgignens]KSV58296.1 hypothetical protein ASU35_13160 [Acetivibrio ethanolgignens]
MEKESSVDFNQILLITADGDCFLQLLSLSIQDVGNSSFFQRMDWRSDDAAQHLSIFLHSIHGILI